MPTFRSGNGSSVTVSATVIPLATAELDISSRDVENTHSGTAGYTNYEHVVYDGKWTCEGPWDEASQAEDYLVPGTKITATFNMGAGAKTTVFTTTLVQEFKFILNNSGDIVRWRSSGKGGTITRPAA